MLSLLRVFGLLALAGSLLGCGSKASSCTGSAGFYCISGGCNQSDVAYDAICSDGVWACASGFVKDTSCGGCIGFVPPNCACRDGGGGLVCRDASAGQ